MRAGPPAGVEDFETAARRSFELFQRKSREDLGDGSGDAEKCTRGGAVCAHAVPGENEGCAGEMLRGRRGEDILLKERADGATGMGPRADPLGMIAKRHVDQEQGSAGGSCASLRRHGEKKAAECDDER